MKVIKRLTAAIGVLGALLVAGPALAQLGLNMPRGVTPISEKIYGLHMQILWICIVIGVIVFGAILYSVIRFRKSKGAVPAQFHHSTMVEVIWTVIPMVILIAIAVPATQVLIEMEDTGNAGVTVKVTGYQWKWGYDYIEDGISFISSLEHDSNLARQRNPQKLPSEVQNYLLEVDNPLVVPTDTKIRFLLTANDVIHSWWVPELGWKKDAIPGFINEASAYITQPGIYRGQCAELCGQDHGFMPVVVVAMPPEQYRQWVQEQKAKQSRDVAAAR